MSRCNEFKGILEKIHIEKFRKFSNLSFSFGSKLTAIVGQNGTMKTTLLGIISQPFSMYYDKENPEITELQKAFFDAKTLDDYKFESKFADKFKFDLKKESVGDHKYTLFFHDNNFVPEGRFSVESIARKPSGIRLWSTKGREQGDGYIHYPVIYLSLKRVSPIGEEGKLSISEKSAEEYLELFKTIAKDILISEEEYTKTDFLKSSNKATLVSHPDTYGASTVSAGQDNIGKILTAVLSFKKLQEEHPTEYRGGLLFIDEIDATLYPAAQKKLIEKLFRLATDYKIQIIFTTHSPTIINTLFDSKYSHHSKVVFLKECSSKIISEENLALGQIEAKLNVSIIPQKQIPAKIRVYTEDEEARIFLKTILPLKYKKNLDILNINIGSEELISLVDSKKIPEFINNMIILDGDKKYSKKSKNIICLPGKNDSSPSSYSVGPDHLIYDYLKGLDNGDNFWPGSKTTGLYDKQICFSSFQNINSSSPRAREKYKDWFLEQKANWGKSNNLPYKHWKDNNPSQVSIFLENFIATYNYLAQKSGLSLLE